jgi:putative ABC transport system ATP-binding protein
MSTDGAIVEVAALERTFRVGRGERAALRSIDLEVRRGELVVVFGPSGAGKTTLLNLLARLDRPTAGSIVVDGVDLAALDEEGATAFRRDRIGFVLQTFGLVPVLTAAENVEVPLRLRRTEPAVRDRRVADLLAAVGLAGRARHFPDQLSGGEQQRVAIARALANDPVVLLADEPTAQLDSATGRRVTALLRELVRDRATTAVVTTHDPIVLEIADRVVRLADGRIVPGPDGRERQETTRTH